MAKRERASTIPVHITGLFLIFAAVFLLLALISYSPTDPGFTLSKHTDTFHNWMGFVGSYIADGLYIIMGVWAFALPIFLMDYAWRYCIRKHPINWLHFASTAIIMFAMLGLLNIFLGELNLFSTTIKAGGAIGKIIGDSLVGYLNRWGSLMLLLMLLAGGIMMGYDMSSPVRGVRDFIERIKDRQLLKNRRGIVERTSETRPSKKALLKSRPDKETSGKEPRITMMEHEGPDSDRGPQTGHTGLY